MAHIFKVGDRARLKTCGSAYSMWVGKEITILARGTVCDWKISVDGVGDTYEGRGINANSRQLEPIQKYDGNQIVEWSECLWQPEGIAA
jgi:hypothetical protein